MILPLYSTIPGGLSPVLGSTGEYRRDTEILQGPLKDHEDDKGIGASNLQRGAERAETVQNREENTQGDL